MKLLLFAFMISHSLLFSQNQMPGSYEIVKGGNPQRKVILVEGSSYDSGVYTRTECRNLNYPVGRNCLAEIKVFCQRSLSYYLQVNEHYQQQQDSLCPQWGPCENLAIDRFDRVDISEGGGQKISIYCL